MTDVQPSTRKVSSTFYVRPTRTLVLWSTQRGVGGPGSALWGGGGRLDLGAGDLAALDGEDLVKVLMRVATQPDRVVPMSRDERAAWMRSWRPGGAQ